MRLVDKRIGLLFALFLCLLGMASARAAWLGTVKAGDLKDRAASQQVEQLDVPAQRGTITDRKGIELAVSEDATTVFANPFLIKDPVGTADKLAPLLGQPADELSRTLADREKGFVYLRRKLDPGLGEKVDKLGIEGIGTVVEPRRTYPQGSLASQLIGTVGTDNTGLSGLEQQFEDSLHGSDGKRKLVKDAMGETISIVESERAEPGEDRRLTIDAALQERTEAALDEIGRAHQPKGATAVVMNPRDGEVLALANWPRYDPNNPSSATPEARSNRAVGSSFEPGSTFKAFTVAGALEDKLIKADDELTLQPTIQVADRTIEESHPRGTETMSVSKILAVSSNVGAVTIGLDLGDKRFDRWVRRFGFGGGTGIDLPGEQAGIVPRPRDYSGSSMGNLPIGQGLAVTPIQMAAAYSALANGGVMHKPHVVAGDGDGSGRRILSTQTADKVSGMLEGVLAAGGTANEAQVPGYVLAGKTGTAEKPDPDTGGYSEDKFFSSFIGFAPAKRPKLMVAVMVDEPQNGYYGGEVAAPAFEKIVDFALPYLKIAPE